MWSIGNEVIEQGSREGARIAGFLVGIVRKEDPTRPAMIASNNARAALKGFRALLMYLVATTMSSQYAKIHKIRPTIPVIGSETSSAISSRGEYFFPFTDEQGRRPNQFPVELLRPLRPPLGNIPDVEFKSHDKFPFSSGEFVWTGFDYLGEPTPYSSNAAKLLDLTDPEEREKMKRELEANGKIPPPSRSSYFGIIDLAGFKKDRFYLYQAHWRPDLPMAHILPHWNWSNRVGEITPGARVYLR